MRRTKAYRLIFVGVASILLGGCSGSSKANMEEAAEQPAVVDYTCISNPESDKQIYVILKNYHGAYWEKVIDGITEAAKKLEKYVQDNNIKGMSGKTNSDGEVMYRDLEKGVYLFVQTQKTQISNQVYQSEPFIITVPGNYDGQIIWNVTAEPKFKNESIPPITTNTPPVSEEPSGDNSSHTSNVKTGDDTNVIMWLSLMGISLVIFSICKRKVHK